MSRRREIERRLSTLHDIGGVMGAMKNLALIEMHKLGRAVQAQRRVVQAIEEAASDLLSAHPELAARPRRTVCLVVGSERGFCGDFNNALASALVARAPAGGPVVAVGRRLWPRLRPSSAEPIPVEGPGLAEECEAALGRIMQALESSGRAAGTSSITVLHHSGDGGGVQVTELAPFSARPVARRHAAAPVLNVAPRALLPELVEQYLFAALSAILSGSLLAENTRRLQHMDNALQRLEQRRLELSLRRNFLRQEEITEEIEVIMLGAGEGSTA